MLTKTALAAWGSGALAVSAAGVLVATQLTAGAASTSGMHTSGGSQSAASGAKVKPTPTATPTSGHGSGNNGNGVGNNPGGAQPAVKALKVTAIKPSSIPANDPSLIAPIAPGFDGTLTVKVENPNQQDVILTSLVGTITGVTPGVGGTPQCEAAWFDIVDFSGAMRITKNSNAMVPLTVSFANLPNVNQDRCKGATYTFSFTATANQA